MATIPDRDSLEDGGLLRAHSSPRDSVKCDGKGTSVSHGSNVPQLSMTGGKKDGRFRDSGRFDAELLAYSDPSPTCLFFNFIFFGFFFVIFLHPPLFKASHFETIQQFFHP